MNSFDNYFVVQWYEKYKEKHKPKGMLLWVDDVRHVPNNYIGDYNIHIAKNYNEAINELTMFRFNVICLDHDLGDGPTGYDICKFIVENHIYCPEYRIHTNNPAGRKNMTELLNRYTRAVIRQC